MKRLTMILLGVLTLPAYGGIASKEYVDTELDKVSTTISTKANKTGYTPNMLLQTKNDGKLTATTLKTNMIENGAVTNSKLASNIGMDKLAMGTLPTSGKHILIWNSADSKYVFEELIKPATGLQCPTGQYDIGFAQCVDPSVNGDSYTEDSSTMTWTATFSYGTINGSALCSSTSGEFGVAGEPDESGTGETRYCWCKTTSPAASRWVFIYGDGDAVSCAYGCALGCAGRVRYYSDFRSGVFAGVGN